MQLSIDAFEPCRDGIHTDTAAFRTALQAIDARGGGTLVVPPGRYLCGGLALPSNFTLVLAPGAELLMSGAYADYAETQTLTVAEQSDRAFLYARGKSNIAITGTGTILGNGAAFFEPDKDANGYRVPRMHRPRVIVFEDCENVRLVDVTIRQAPMWTVHLVSCTRVFVDRLTVDNDLSMSNTDALDIDACRDVHISNCNISAADDCICIKTTEKPQAIRRAARNIVVSNCTLRSKSCAVKIGTETFDDIEDVLVSNCVITESNRGVGLVSRDGGHLRRIFFSNLSIRTVLGDPCHWGKADPIFVSVRARNPAVAPGVIDTVRFADVAIETEGALNLHSEVPGMLREVVLSGLRVVQRETRLYEQGLFDLRPPCNPARPTGVGLDNAYRLDPATGRAFGVQPYPDGMPALFSQGAAGLKIHHIEISRPDPLPQGWCADAIVVR